MYNTLSDKELVDASRNASEKNASSAINTLILRYLPIIRTIAMDFKKSDLETDDFVQEGLFSLIQAIKTYDETKEASFSTYVSICVRRRLLSIVKVRKKDFPNDVLVSLNNNNEVLNLGGSDCVEDELVNRDAYEILMKKINNVLSPFEQSVFNCYLDVFTYEEIALALGTTPKSVDNALQRIRKKLRELT